MQKIAIVTGGAKGLGAYLSESLGRDGYTVVVHYKSSKKEAEEIVSKVGNTDSFAISADLKSESEVSAMFVQVEQKLGRVDLLVNNVGNFLFKPFGKTTNAEFKDLMESNVYSTLFCSRAVLPIMKKQNVGHIVNIGAVGAERLILRENSMPYFLGKTGIYVLTKTMAWEEAKNGVHINMISPASMVADIFEKDDFPMGRPTEYADVYKALTFLTSDQAYYINGANIEVSGAFVPGMDKAE